MSKVHIGYAIGGYPGNMSDYTPSELVLALRISGTEPDDIYRYLKEYNEDPDRTVNRITSRVRVDTLLDNIDRAKEILHGCKSEGIGFLTMLDESFPRRLISRNGSCVCLFFKGDTTLLNAKKSVSITGTKKPSEDRLKTGCSIIEVLSSKGVATVVGIGGECDKRAAEAALSRGGSVIAVCAETVESCLSGTFGELAGRIVTGGGLIVSELHQNRGDSRRFGERDRIVSMLGAGTLIMDSDGSVSAVTKRSAKDGKKIYAVGEESAPAGAVTVGADDAYVLASELVNRRRRRHHMESILFRRSFLRDETISAFSASRLEILRSAARIFSATEIISGEKDGLSDSHSFAVKAPNSVKSDVLRRFSAEMRSSNSAESIF